MRKVIVFLLNFFYVAAVIAQTKNEKTGLPNVFPVNPKAFEFLKYTEVPVSKYTGVPNISIPIHTIKTNGLDVPISLSYHSNGFRVTEEAGWTGLGWTLNGGGAIVQVVNGYDDFGYYRNRNIEAQEMVNASTTMPSSILGTCTTVNFFLQQAITAVTFPPPANSGILNFQGDSRLIDGLKDIAPDVFKFNAMGYSGEFILDWKNEKFKCLTDQNIKIENINYSYNAGGQAASLGDFTITVPDGTKFIFSLKEETSISYIDRGATPPYMQRLELNEIIGQKSSRTFQLTTVYTKGGDRIDLNYIQTGILENFPAISQSSDVYTWVKHPYAGHEPTKSISDFFSNSYGNVTANYSRQSLSYLSSITFPEGKLVFNSSNDRIDFIGARKLNSIELKDLSDNLVKKFDFSYDYFIGDSSGNDTWLNTRNYNTGKVATELTHRLKLLSVKEAGTSPHVFTYYSNTLPKKTSWAIDNWGYYSGSISGPEIGLIKFKDAGLAFYRAGLLQQITYPTGGTSSFEYELNSFDNYKPGSDVSSTPSADIFLSDKNNANDNRTQILSFNHPAYLGLSDLYLSTYGNDNVPEIGPNTYIRLTTIKKTPENIALIYTTPATFWTKYNSTSFGGLGAVVNNVVDDKLLIRLNFNQTTQKYETLKIQGSSGISLTPDNIYVVEAHFPDNAGPQGNSSSGPQGAASASLKYYSGSDTIRYDIAYGGGLRIKTIKTEDKLSPPLIKKFQYQGGKLMSPLLYKNRNSFDFGYVDIAFIDPNSGYPVFGYFLYTVTKTTTSSSNYYTLSTNASGQYVGYDQVEEIDSVAGSILPNGKIVTSYTNTPDYFPLNDILFPGGIENPNAVNPLGFLYPAQKSPIDNGLELETRIFDKNLNLIKRTRKSYQNTQATCSYGRLSAYAGQFTVSDQYLASKHSVGLYPIHTTKTLNFSSEETNFSGGDSITIRNIFSYDSKEQINYSYTINSKKDTVKTFLQYPYNFPTEYSAMNNANIITPVIEKKVQVNTKPISIEKNQYEVIYDLIGYPVYVLKKNEETEGNGNFIKATLFDTYASKERKDKFKLLQYHDSSNINTSIIWGYSGQYPVAKIVGSNYNTAKQFINQAIIDNPASDQQLRDEIAKIRTGLAGSPALVTTYTYKPLVGVTSITDPKGTISNFEYDANSRLKVVRDQQNNILSAYSYQFQEPFINPCSPIWTNTATAIRCQLNSSNENTGNQEQEQKDTNPCSATYNQTRWTVTGTNTSACPVPVLMVPLYYKARISSNVSLYLLNMANGQSYSFTLTTSSPSGYIPIGQVPAGRYVVQMKAADNLPHTFSINGLLPPIAVTYTGSDIILCPTCGNINIYQ